MPEAAKSDPPWSQSRRPRRADVLASSPHAPLFVQVLFPARLPPVTNQSATMRRSSPFIFLVLLAVTPLVTTAATFDCVGGVYKANSTYEANLRRLAAVLLAETASSQRLQAFRGVGYWPNRVRASSRCYWGVSSSSCAACVAGAFREAERACPYGKKAVVFTRNCTLSFADFPRTLGLGGNSWFDLFGAALIFQAIGFAWLFFMLLQEWRDKKRASMMRCSSLPSGDSS